MSVAVYVRVSTASQNEAGQKREIKRWLDGNGIRADAVMWFVDKASGDTLDRPEFEKLQNSVFNGEVDTIVVWKLDRLSRSLRDGLNVLCDWIERRIRIVSVTQQIDLNGTLGKLLASVLLAFSEMEQETRRERQAVGIRAARERGVYKGRKPGSTKAAPQRALKLRNERNLSDQEIAAVLNVSRRTVQRYLRIAERAGES
ncbi:MAG: recombinase family protein [Planctomycetota bacterium]|jgi:DNA invertase Pin-like site-specific DNA recombinase